MDGIVASNSLEIWLLHWGSIALFFLLAVGIIALPVPEETLMVIAGALVHGGKLHIIPTFFAALLGSLCGITVSYFLGKGVGHYIVRHFGKWLGIKQSQMDIAHNWFEKYGRWAIFIGYFIPGIRHFTGISAGATDLAYSHFILFAFTGALCWISTFLSIGYFLGGYCSFFCCYLMGQINSVLSITLLFLSLFGLYFTHRKVK